MAAAEAGKILRYTNSLHLTELMSGNPYANGANYEGLSLGLGLGFDTTWQPSLDIAIEASHAGVRDIGANRYFVGARGALSFPFLYAFFNLFKLRVPALRIFRLVPYLQVDAGKSELNLGAGQVPSGAFDLRLIGGGLLAFRHIFSTGVGFEVGVGVQGGFSIARSVIEWAPVLSTTLLYRLPKKAPDDCEERLRDERYKLNACLEQLHPFNTRLHELAERTKNFNGAAKDVHRHNSQIYESVRLFCAPPPPPAPPDVRPPSVGGIPPQTVAGTCEEEMRAVKDAIPACEMSLRRHRRDKGALDRVAAMARVNYDAQFDWSLRCAPPIVHPPDRLPFANDDPDIALRPQWWPTDGKEKAADGVPIFANATLDDVLRYMYKHPDAKLKINAYANDTGDKGHNLELAEKRLKAVISYLTLEGLDKCEDGKYGKRCEYERQRPMDDCLSKYESGCPSGPQRVGGAFVSRYSVNKGDKPRQFVLARERIVGAQAHTIEDLKEGVKGRRFKIKQFPDQRAMTDDAKSDVFRAVFLTIVEEEDESQSKYGRVGGGRGAGGAPPLRAGPRLRTGRDQGR